MTHHNESDRLSTPHDEKPNNTTIAKSPQIDAATMTYILKRFPRGVQVSERLAILLNNPKDSIAYDEAIYPIAPFLRK